MSLGARWQRVAWGSLALALLLTGMGISTVATASIGDGPDWAWMQARWAVVGLAACLLATATPYRRVVQAGFPLYGLGIGLLVLVLFKGTGQSAGRWIGLGGFRMQPSELMKLILVVLLAGRMRYERSHYRLGGLLWPLALTLVPVALVMKQPDLGTALLLLPILFAILYAAGARVRHLSLVVVVGLAVGAALYFVPGVLKDYQRARLFSFVLEYTDPEAAEEMAQGQLHQVRSGQLAVGLGGLAGAEGEGGGVEEAIAGLSERHSDFIFPVFAARWGFLGVTLLLVLYLLFLGSVLSIAQRLREPSGRLLVVGVFTLFAAQACVNLGMTVGLLPVVGVPLPFFTYGGSSLLTSFLALGLCLNAGADPPVEFGRTTFEE